MDNLWKTSSEVGKVRRGIMEPWWKAPSVQIQLRRDVASAWEDANPILASGEPGVELDTQRLKVGDGVTHWTNLEYFQGVIVDVEGNRHGEFRVKSL